MSIKPQTECTLADFTEKAKEGKADGGGDHLSPIEDGDGEEEEKPITGKRKEIKEEDLPARLQALETKFLRMEKKVKTLEEENAAFKKKIKTLEGEKKKKKKTVFRGNDKISQVVCAVRAAKPEDRKQCLKDMLFELYEDGGLKRKTLSRYIRKILKEIPELIINVNEWIQEELLEITTDELELE